MLATEPRRPRRDELDAYDDEDDGLDDEIDLTVELSRYDSID
jgi:hypothetical protein